MREGFARRKEAPGRVIPDIDTILSPALGGLKGVARPSPRKRGRPGPDLSGQEDSQANRRTTRLVAGRQRPPVAPMRDPGDSDASESAGLAPSFACNANSPARNCLDKIARF